MTAEPTWRELPFAPAAGEPLCAVDDVPADNGREFVFGEGPRVFRLVVFRADSAGGIRAYLNECPHAGIPMQFSEQAFCVMEIDGRRELLCPHHSALFHLDDGHCHEGPCEGDDLMAVDVVVEHGMIRVG